MTERVYLGRADPYFTPADKAEGYPETRRRLAGYSDADLLDEYREHARAAFDRMFGHHAARFANLIVDELHARGIVEAPGLFGPRPVVKVGALD